jgi:hypothetical protein
VGERNGGRRRSRRAARLNLTFRSCQAARGLRDTLEQVVHGGEAQRKPTIANSIEFNFKIEFMNFLLTSHVPQRRLRNWIATRGGLPSSVRSNVEAQHLRALCAIQFAVWHAPRLPRPAREQQGRIGQPRGE